EGATRADLGGARAERRRPGHAHERIRRPRRSEGPAGRTERPSRARARSPATVAPRFSACPSHRNVTTRRQHHRRLRSTSPPPPPLPPSPPSLPATRRRHNCKTTATSRTTVYTLPPPSPPSQSPTVPPPPALHKRLLSHCRPTLHCTGI
ncbi:Uncharacterized protein FWK35_00008088, partial [Aphis craccivora]